MFQYRIIGLNQFSMRKRVGKKSIKRLVTILRIYPFQCFLMNQICRILRTFLIIITKHRIFDIFIHRDTYGSSISFRLAIPIQKVWIIEVSLKLTDKPVVLINTTLVWRRARTFITTGPFAKHTCSIPVFFHYFRKNDMIRIVWFLTDNRIFIIRPILH